MIPTRIALPRTLPARLVPTRTLPARFALIGAVSIAVAACGAGDDTDPAGATVAPVDDLVVATTTIWADVATNVRCGRDVPAIIPVGADPHTFEPSLRDRELLEGARTVVANGNDLEGSLVDLLDTVAAEGTNVVEMATHVDVLVDDDTHDDDTHDDDDHDDEAGDHDDGTHDDDGDEGEHDDDTHDDDGDEGEHDDDGHGHTHDDDGDTHDDDDEAGDHDGDTHDDDDEAGDHDGDTHDDGDGDEGEHGDDGHGHAHAEDGDPHIWHDPRRVAGTLDVLAGALADDADVDEVRSCADDYRAELEALDAEIEALLAPIPDDRRILVTSHDSLAYFADRYGFEIVGTVIPSTTTIAETSAAQLAELADTITEYGVPAIFTDRFESDVDAEALADRLDIAIVPLHGGSLTDDGAASTYVGMMRANAEAIADALT